MRVVVTGAHGFIGRAVQGELVRQGYRAATLGVGNRQPGIGYGGRIPDLDAVDSLARWLSDQRPDGVLHLAGTTDPRFPALCFAVNAGFAATMLEAAWRAGLQKVPILLVGSAAEYGPPPDPARPVDETVRADPVSPYGISKLAQTRLAMAAAARGQAVIVARLFNVVGSGMPHHLSLPSFARRIEALAKGADGVPEAPLRVGNLDAVRDFVTVEFAAEALVALLASSAARGRIVNLCGGRPYRMGDLLDRLIGLSGLDIAVEGTTGVDSVYGDPGLLNRLIGRPAAAIRNADLLDVLRDAGCPVRGMATGALAPEALAPHHVAGIT